MYFQKPGRKSEKRLEEFLKILKTCKKFKKPGENFQKSFGHPVFYNCKVFTIVLSFQKVVEDMIWTQIYCLEFCYLKLNELFIFAAS